MLLALLFAACAHSASETDALAETYAAAQQQIAAGQTSDGLRALKQMPSWFALAHWSVAEVEFARGGWLAAFVAYKRYLVVGGQRVEDRSDVRLRLGELENRLPVLQEYADGEREAFAKNWERVVERMTSVIEKRPSFSLSYRLLGIAHAALGQFDQSIDAYAKYLELEPDAPDAKTVVGYVAKKKVGS